MKKFIEKLHAQEPHLKREFSVHAALGVTAIVFLIWVSTLGVRLTRGSASGSPVSGDAANLVAATAQAGAAFQGQLQGLGSSDTSGSAEPGALASSSPQAAPQAAPATVIGSPNQ